METIINNSILMKQSFNEDNELNKAEKLLRIRIRRKTRYIFNKIKVVFQMMIGKLKNK